MTSEEERNKAWNDAFGQFAEEIVVEAVLRMRREVAEQLNVLHELWTWAVGLPGYDKKKWQRLESLCSPRR